MIGVLDVHYTGDVAWAACVLAGEWAASESLARHVVRVEGIAPYVPGAFYQRELPALLEVLAAVDERPEVLVVDGYVWLDGGAPGLGAHLHSRVGEAMPVVGIAKNPYDGATDAVEVLRGGSTRALWVSAVGMRVEDAVAAVRSMAGEHRIPKLVREVDQVARAAGG